MKHEIIVEAVKQCKTAMVSGNGTNIYQIIEGALDKYEDYLLDIQGIKETDD